VSFPHSSLQLSSHLDLPVFAVNVTMGLDAVVLQDPNSDPVPTSPEFPPSQNVSTNPEINEDL
jgi:hypothetical protein